jgi:CheY-like chemotaxis protein
MGREENKVAGELILIVEDNEKNRKLLRDVLRFKGYQTVETETAEEGIRLAQESQPALILMDIQLPGIDGITALRQLRADPGTRKIPIIAVTASAMIHSRKEILAEGFDGYQTKPISLKDFLEEVRRVLDARGS